MATGLPQHPELGPPEEWVIVSSTEGGKQALADELTMVTAEAVLCGDLSLMVVYRPTNSHLITRVAPYAPNTAGADGAGCDVAVADKVGLAGSGKGIDEELVLPLTQEVELVKKGDATVAYVAKKVAFEFGLDPAEVWSTSCSPSTCDSPDFCAKGG